MSEIRIVPVSSIIPYDNNPRKNDKAVDDVVESIKQCGYRAKIIVAEDMVVLCGHTRLKAIKKLGWNECEVQIEKDIDEEQKKKYRLLDNKTSELAEWDAAKLIEELKEIDFDGYDFGFDMSWMDEEAKDDDFEPKLPDEPKSQRGEIYQLGRHRLMCGDSTKLEDVRALCDGRQVDMLLTDPPYGVSYVGKTKDALTIENDAKEDGEFLEFLTAAFSAADDVMKPGAVFYIWHADSKGAIFRNACQMVAWEVRQCLIWVKNSMVLGRLDYQWKHEPCLYGWKGGASHLWASDRKQTTVLEFDKPQKNKEHPTMKPVPLFDYQIQNNTKGGDIVLDLFGGSGTTMVACEEDGRVAYCMEYDPKYVDVIIERWEKLTGEKATLIKKIGGGIRTIVIIIKAAEIAAFFSIISRKMLDNIPL